MADESKSPIEATDSEAELGSEQNPLSSQKTVLEGGQEISDLEPGLGQGEADADAPGLGDKGDENADDAAGSDASGDAADSEGEEDETVDAEDLDDDDFSEHISKAGSEIFDEGKARENVGKIRNQGTTIEFIEILVPRQPALEAAMRAEATAKAVADGSLKPEDHPAKDPDGNDNPNSGGDADKGNSRTSATEPTDDEAVNPKSGPVHIGIGGQTAPSPIAPDSASIHPDVDTDPLPDDPANLADKSESAEEEASAEASGPADRESADNQADGFKDSEGEESPEKSEGGSTASTDTTDGSDASAAVSGNLPTTPNLEAESGEEGFDGGDALEPADKGETDDDGKGSN